MKKFKVKQKPLHQIFHNLCVKMATCVAARGGGVS